LPSRIRLLPKGIVALADVGPNEVKVEKKKKYSLILENKGFASRFWRKLEYNILGKTSIRKTMLRLNNERK